MKNGKVGGIPFAEKEEIFLRRHPEFENVTPILLGTFITCQAKKLKGRTQVDVDEAYQHIFRTKCSWCRTNFKSLSDYQETFFK